MGGTGAPRPLDFSIAEGRIGAVRRIGAAPRPECEERATALKLDLAGSLLVNVVGGMSSRSTFTIALEATLADLHAEIAARSTAEAAFHRIIAGGRLLSKPHLVIRKSMPLDDADAQVTMEALGLREGDKVKVVVTPQDESEALKAQSSRESVDNRYLTFDEELARERRRATGEPAHARRRTHGSLSDFRFGFRRIEPLHSDPNTHEPYQHPPPAEARALLERLANDPGIVAVMKKHEFSVGLLTELPPTMETGLIGHCDHCLLGLNKNAGEQILLRLRTSDCRSFRPYLSIRETLVHELTHNRFGDHDEKFWALFRVLMRESKDLDWSQGTAHRSGEAAAAAAESMMPMEYVLGGAVVDDVGEFDTPAERAAMAAQLRGYAAVATAGKNGGVSTAEADCCSGLKETKGNLDSGKEQQKEKATPAEHTEPARTGEQRASREPMAEAPHLDASASADGEAVVLPLEELLAMGFSEADAAAALQKFHGSTQRAADFLLTRVPGEGEEASKVVPEHVSSSTQSAPTAPIDHARNDDVGSRGFSHKEAQMRERVGNAINRLVGDAATDLQAARRALETILGIIVRIQSSPTQLKYRQLRLANPALAEKVGKIGGGYALLLASGFRYSSDALFFECPSEVTLGELAVASSLLSSALDALPTG